MHLKIILALLILLRTPSWSAEPELFESTRAKPKARCGAFAKIPGLSEIIARNEAKVRGSDLSTRFENLKDTRWGTERSILEVTAAGVLVLDGIPAQAFTAPANHDKGAANDGLYTFFRENSPRILKVVGLDSRYPDHSALQGMLMGQALEGPVIVRSGTIQLPNGRVGLFVEMNEMAHGKESFTLKGLISKKDKKSIRLLIQGEGERYTSQIARQLITAFKHRVVLSDIDMIMSGNKAAWLDTSGWVYRPGEPTEEHAECFRTILSNLNYRDPGVAIVFFNDLLKNIRLDPNMTVAEKKELLRMTRLGNPSDDLMKQIRGTTEVVLSGTAVLSNEAFLLKEAALPE